MSQYRMVPSDGSTIEIETHTGFRGQQPGIVLTVSDINDSVSVFLSPTEGKVLLDLMRGALLAGFSEALVDALLPPREVQG